MYGKRKLEYGVVGSSSFGAAPVFRRPRFSSRMRSAGVLPNYVDFGEYDCVCEYCGACFWFVERSLKVSRTHHPRYGHCCKSGDVILHYPSFPPEYVAIFHSDCFLRDIRAYNSMFGMTSFGANVDEEINDGHSPYVFKVSGQISYKIGSFYPDPTKGPRFLQLYLFDADNEVSNWLIAFPNRRRNDFDANIVTFLITFLKANNEYTIVFCSFV
ncbi:unnamed protein product [Lactuca saligna]|uniref:Uncharacterized protein n=1 Tax=Lactuca saligna TaxID=75948 RepID=A0AA35ZWU7_LACSI|nr:unnamed protein product [Lactuca saligna]